MAGIIVDIGASVTRLQNGLKRARKNIAMFALNVAATMAKAGLNAAMGFARSFIRHIRRAGLVAGGLLAAGIGRSISEAGRFEGYQFQFEALMGSAERARARMEEIKEVDLRAPFDITQIANASRMLEVFTAGAFAGADALTMMADAAAVTPRPLEEIAYWYGRAYSMIRANRPLGEAVMRLTEMGLISAEASIQLQRLSKSYSPRAQARKMEIINAAFMRFEGAAARMATTWGGVVSIFSSGTKQAFAAVGEAILPLAKEWLQELIDKMAELRRNGTLTRWGQNIANAARNARAAVESVIPSIRSFVTRAMAYFGQYEDALRSGNIGYVLSSLIEDGVAASLNILHAAAPKFAEVAFAIGAEIGSGIVRGIAAYLSGPQWESFVRSYLPFGNTLVEYGETLGDIAYGNQTREGRRSVVEGIGADVANFGGATMDALKLADAAAMALTSSVIGLENTRALVGTSSNPMHVIIDNQQGGM